MYVIFKRCFYPETGTRDRVLCDLMKDKVRRFPTEDAAWTFAARLNPGKLEVLRVSALEASQVAMVEVMAACPALRFSS